MAAATWSNPNSTDTSWFPLTRNQSSIQTRIHRNPRDPWKSLEILDWKKNWTSSSSSPDNYRNGLLSWIICLQSFPFLSFCFSSAKCFNFTKTALKMYKNLAIWTKEKQEREWMYQPCNISVLAAVWWKRLPMENIWRILWKIFFLRFQNICISFLWRGWSWTWRTTNLTISKKGCLWFFIFLPSVLVWWRRFEWENDLVANRAHTLTFSLKSHYYESYESYEWQKICSINNSALFLL